MSLSQTFSTRLPSFQQFKKLNSIILKPPPYKNPSQSLEPLPKNQNQIKSKKGLILNTTNHDTKIKAYLSEIYQSYITRFEKVCKEVIQTKYEKIYKEIYQFAIMSNFFTSSIFSSLIINTDQNSGSFFDGLKRYLLKKINQENNASMFDIEHIIIPKGEIHFKDLNKLFYDLNIDNMNYELNNENETTRTRIIIIGEIHRIEAINLNLFLQRMMEYQRETNKQFNNILLFDVVYDPRSLFDKIKANLLCKMNFYSIDNVPSKNIYKEVLYKFIYEKSSSLFIPNSDNTKIIVDYVNNHQISIESFKHYFKFIIFQFFLMHNWDDDEYLIFSPEIENIVRANPNDDEVKIVKIKQFLKEKLQDIYSNDIKTPYLDLKEDVNSLFNTYVNHKTSRNIFFDFYNMFEKIFTEISEKNGEEEFFFDKYQFFFEFLQYGKNEGREDTKKSRVKVLSNYFEKFPNKDYALLLTDYILPNYYQTIEIISSRSTEYQDFLSRSKKMLEDAAKDLECPQKMLTLEMVLDKIIWWIKYLFDMPFFDSINKYDINNNTKKTKRKWLNIYQSYLQFYEIVNPSLLSIIMKMLTKEICNEENNKNYEVIPKNYTYENMLTCYIKCFMRIGSNFKLKYFFWEFINEFGIADVESEKEKEDVRKCKKIFLYFSYFFCLIGFFSRKRGNGEFFIKNYYSITNYYIKN